MIGNELKAALAEMKISRRQFCDALAEAGYQIGPETVRKWTTKTIPAICENMAVLWQAKPSARPAKMRHNRAGIYGA